MVSIIVELQSCALHMREAFCSADFERHAFTTCLAVPASIFTKPALLNSTIILLADSMSHNVAIAQASLFGSFCEKTEETASIQHSQIDNSSTASTRLLDSDKDGSGADIIASEVDGVNEDSSFLSTEYLKANLEEFLQNGNQEFRSVAVVSLWNSFLDEAKQKMQDGPSGLVLDYDVLQKFVSPVSVEVEPDDYMECLGTDLIYQMVLSLDPINPLLLCKLCTISTLGCS
ncbi:hypothetical protein ACH5RR_016606 [Cinchona calisaya]|uniref:Uncharacterized protein n=1 Tax=Cinchona calisaya TaxID=153742 RepID=A0ABD3A033_9GENT